jgi:tetratricopeptide (TPR) repeat protein
MAENQEQKSRRDKALERLKAKYPDKEYADDEALIGQMDDDYASIEEELGRYKEREGKLSELLSKDPRSAQFITDMAKGKDPWIAVIERMGIDGVTDLMNDPSKQEAYAEANKAYVERLAKEKDLEAEYQTNFAESMKMLEQMQQERGLSDKTVDAAMDLVMKMANEAIVGKFTTETIDMALKAVNHDTDMEEARAEGQVAGKNAKIDEQLRKQKGGDGLPAMGGTNNAPAHKKSRGSLVDYAESIGIKV